MLQSSPAALLFPQQSYRQGDKELFQWWALVWVSLSWGFSGRPLLQIPRPIIPTGTWTLSSIMPHFFSLKNLVTMDTIKEAPLSTKANG